jgi:hypothetical protein
MTLAEPSSEEIIAVEERATRLIEQVRSRDDAILNRLSASPYITVIHLTTYLF